MKFFRFSNMSSLLLLSLLLSIAKVASFVFKVDTNTDEVATGDKIQYLLTSTLTNYTTLSLSITLPYNISSLFTISSVEITKTGANLVLPAPLSKPVIKTAGSNAGSNKAVWSLGTIQRLDVFCTEPTLDTLVVRAKIQAQDHHMMIKNSIHWLNFAAVYNESQYAVQKPVTIRSGGVKFVKLDLRMNSTFQSSQDSIYIAGQTRSFDVEISHHHDSRASGENLELIILTQDYLQLESVTTANLPSDAYEVANTPGRAVVKIPYLNLHQTLSFKISVKVGVFTPNISRSMINDYNFTNNVIAELHYHGVSSEICQQDTQIVAKTFDYQIAPVFDEEEASFVEPFPLIEKLPPSLKCSSCGFHDCCSTNNVKLNSQSYWIPFSVEDKQQFLEFDFRTPVMLKEISLQGSGSKLGAFVKTFSLMSSNDGIRWTTQIYRGKNQIYSGNIDSESIVVRKIKPVLKSRYVRIIPLSWHKRAALRLDFFIKFDDVEAFQIYGPKRGRCVGNVNSSALFQVECKTTKSLDRWIWTDHEQLRHLKTGACLSRGRDGNAELQVCDPQLNVQKWYCHEDKLASKDDNSVLHLRSDQTINFTTIERSTQNDVVEINSSRKSLCSEKGDPPLALRQMLWNKNSYFFVCDLNSRSEETANHCMFTKDDGKSWEDLDVQLFNLLGISQIYVGSLYGVTFGRQKNAVKLLHYGYSIVQNILMSKWEEIKKNTTLQMEFPVNITFIPFGETPESETPTDKMTLRSSAGMPAWGASSAGIHKYVSGEWNLVLSWSKLGTRYARPGSCKQTLAFGHSKGNGVYTIYPAHPLVAVQVYCDMTRDGGGWTLLVTSKTPKWNISQVFERAAEEPSISKDHSILKHADDIKAQSEEECFQYRLEASVFGQDGGIWRAPKSYSFVARNNLQTDVELLTKFGNWEYSDMSLGRRMPWICNGSYCPAVFTTADYDPHYYGTIISGSLYSLEYGLPAPWFFNSNLTEPGIVWYWMREGGC